MSSENIDSIEENLSGELQPVGEEMLPEHIDKEAAMSLCERIASRRDKIEELRELATIRIYDLKEKIELTEAWLEKEKKQHESAIVYFATPLEHYMRALNASNPKIKSLNLPTGTLRLRKKPDTVELKEGFELSAANRFAKTKISYSLDRVGIKDQILTTGEIPEYVEVIPGEVTFSIETINEVKDD